MMVRQLKLETEDLGGGFTASALRWGYLYSQSVGKRKYRIRYYQERHRKKSPRQSTTSQPAAGSHGSLFLWTSLDFHTVNILSLRARGELWRRSKFAQIR